MTPSTFGGLATGIGSWPGTDVREAVAIVLGELGELPHVVELPGRGLGADMIGRTGAIMVDVELDVRTSGYRVVPRPMLAGRRATDFLTEDLDVLEELWEVAGLRGAGRTIKVQAAGPFTMAAQVELRHGHRALTDRGALRHFAESLGEGLRLHCAEVARRLSANVVVQLDEPSLAAVLAGSLTGITGIDSVRAIPEPEVLDLLDSLIDTIALPVAVHCCDGELPSICCAEPEPSRWPWMHTSCAEPTSMRWESCSRPARPSYWDRCRRQPRTDHPCGASAPSPV